jgi:peptidoglycan/xylan/chitin deacetylase (PgdA/CDA1 family)
MIVKSVCFVSMFAAVVAVAFWGRNAAGGETSKVPQIIVLKLDDVVGQSAPNALPVPPRWQRVTDFLKKSNLKASYGIIGFSLEEDNPAYFDWIKNLHQSGQFEFWNHGYRNRKATDKSGEFEESFEAQKTALDRTQELAKKKLGIELKAFGPHWSGTNEQTVRAIETIPELAMWFYGPKNTTKFVFPRYLTLEDPTHVPDFAKFQATYQKVAYDKPCVALQGHPNSWDDKRWENFVEIIEFLKAKGCVFLTASEAMAKLK